MTMAKNPPVSNLSQCALKISSVVIPMCHQEAEAMLPSEDRMCGRRNAGQVLNLALLWLWRAVIQVMMVP